MSCIAKVDAFKKHRQLGRCDFLRCLSRVRPREATPFESLREQAQAGAIPVDSLQAISCTVAENDELTVGDAPRQVLFDDPGQTIECFTKISYTAAKIDALIQAN